MNLDRDTKIELVRTAVPNVVVPLLKAGVNHKLTMKQMDRHTDCGFCHNVANSLMEAPTAEARQGADELRTYIREVERIEGQDDMTEARAEEIVHDLVDRWEVVPKHATGMA